jgi:hypothetical protein
MGTNIFSTKVVNKNEQSIKTEKNNYQARSSNSGYLW